MRAVSADICRRWRAVLVSAVILVVTISPNLYPITLDSCRAYDTPVDGGGSVTIQWMQTSETGSADDSRDVVIFRRSAQNQSWDRIAIVPAVEKSYVDSGTSDGIDYEYKLATEHNGGYREKRIGPVASANQWWFDGGRVPVLIGVVLSIVILAGVTLYKSGGKQFYIRPIRGLEAVDEAVGRATEMGRPVLFTPGWGGDIQRPTTIAALNILRYVAVRTAEYKCDLYFPTHDPVIMAAAEEVIHEAYIEQGRADNFSADNVFYTTTSQLGYAAAVDGLITRCEPAAVFLLGTFEGEALILAETGNSINAMQVAGTDSTIQLSFFMVACDYTLIGEELFAASGYLTQDSKILSSVKVQDYLKAIIGILLLMGAILATFGLDGLAEWIGQT